MMVNSISYQREINPLLFQMDRRDQRDQRRREGSPPRGGMYRQGPRFERRPHSNSGWNRGRRSNSSESEDEDRSPKKNVK